MHSSSMLRIAYTLFLVALLAGIGAGAESRAVRAGGPWYVSPTGDDGNDCLSPATACKTIGGAIGKAASGDTINIAAGTYDEAIAIFGKDLSFVGAGAASTFIEGDEFGTNARLNATGISIRNGGGVFIAAASSVATLSNVVISGNLRGIQNFGTLTVTNSTISGNIGASVGAGIWNRTGALATLTNVVMSGNKARDAGGGILNTGTLTLTNVILSTNTVTDTTNSSGTGGGAIFNDGDLRFTGGIVANNRAGGHGGGILNVNTATLRDITVSGNQAPFAAGVENYVLGITATLTLIDTTISGNSASSGPGGGFLNSNAAADLINVTLNGNTANQGGAIYNAGPLRLKNSIVNGSCDVGGQAINSLGHNLENGTTCGLTGPGDLRNVDPHLGPLQNNGGFSPTHALLPDSQAIDAGDNAGCPTTDQRGTARPTDGDGNGVAICDIGAYEFERIFAIYLPLIRK